MGAQAVMRRTRLLLRSTKKRSPRGSKARSPGLLMAARLAGPPSPLKPVTPVPVRVLMIPPLTIRILWLFWSDI